MTSQPGPARPPSGDTWTKAAGSGQLQARWSIATVTLGGPLTARLRAAARAGFRAVEVFDGDLAASGLPPAAVKSRASDYGLSIPLYGPLRDFEAAGDQQFRRNLQRASRALEVVTSLGADILLVCSNTSPSAVDDDARAADQLCLLADQAAACGVRVAYEALSWGKWVSSYQHAWRLVADRHPSLGLCLDSFHILARGHDPGEISTIPAGKIFFVQLADAPRMALDLKTWSRHHRCLPGHGDLNIAGFAAQVRSSGYQGPWSLEIFSDRLSQADPRQTARDAMHSLVALEEQCRPADTGAVAQSRLRNDQAAVGVGVAAR